jgi:hypothetical protein
MNAITINVVKDFDANQLWTSVTGSAWEQAPWWRRAKYNKEAIADWEEQGDPSTFAIEVEIEDPEDEEKVIAKIVTFSDIIEGCKKVWEGKHYHCFGTRIDDNIYDYDSCAGDVIMQVVMLGKVVYG